MPWIKNTPSGSLTWTTTIGGESKYWSRLTVPLLPVR